jgi:hypothetical protein
VASFSIAIERPLQAVLPWRAQVEQVTFTFEPELHSLQVNTAAAFLPLACSTNFRVSKHIPSFGLELQVFIKVGS